MLVGSDNWQRLCGTSLAERARLKTEEENFGWSRSPTSGRKFRSPHGRRWRNNGGDPVYRAKTVDVVACRGIVRPLAFHYSVYEATRTVVLVSVRLFADFD